MKKYLITILAVLSSSFAAVVTSSAQSANFSYNDGAGSPNSGSYLPGSSFTFAISLNFTAGGSVNNLEGVSYWFQQDQASPFYFSITSRDATGSGFDLLQTDPLGVQSLAPDNANDLGAIRSDFVGVGSGTYFVANITIAIDPGTAPGVYTLENVTSGPHTSFLFDDSGENSLAIPASSYTITVMQAVPEGGSTLALLGLALAGMVVGGRLWKLAGA